MSTSDAPTRDAAGPSKGLRAAFLALPRWKRVALGLALLAVLVGGVLLALEGDRPSSADDAATPVASVPGTGLTASGTTWPGAPPLGSPPPTESGSTESAPLHPWSAFFLKGGFSFFVGFCVGHALRAFFKISAAALGVVFLALFGLSYLGVVEMDWSMLEGHFDALAARVKDEAGSFRTFMEGSLPSAGMASLGLFAGFKK